MDGSTVITIVSKSYNSPMVWYQSVKKEVMSMKFISADVPRNAPHIYAYIYIYINLKLNFLQ